MLTISNTLNTPNKNHSNYKLAKAPSFKSKLIAVVEAPKLKEPLAFDSVEFSATKNTKKSDFLKQSEQEIKDKILAVSKKKENFIGCGTEAKVYKIEDTGYCVKIPYISDNLKDSCLSFDLNEKDKVNHVVAKFSNGATVMNLINGFSLEGCQSREFPREKRNELLINLPVSSFQGLLKQICHAKDLGMIFDCTATNLIIDPKDRSITPIDFYEMDPDYPEVVKPLRYMLEAMGDSNCFDFRKKVICKILLAAIEELKPNVTPCLSVGEFKFSDFMEISQLGNPLRNSQEWSTLKKILTDIECLKIKEIAGNNVSDILQLKIEEAQTLIQVLSSCV